MITKILKWTSIVLGSVIGLAAVLVAALYVTGNARLTQTYTVQPEAIAIPADEASVARGQRMSFMGKTLLAAGAFGDTILPAEVIAHAGPRLIAVESGVNAQYGEYLVRLGGCRDCHGKDFSGGKSPEPGSPPAPNLTPGGPIGQWSSQVFITVVRTGASENMPWDELAPLTDSELEAIYLYLQSLPAR